MNWQTACNPSQSLDAISIEVIHNGLRSIADECFIALMKSAYSTNIKERHDHSACIMDATGRIIVQAALSQSIHLSSMLGHVREVLYQYSLKDLHEGDILISNDPFAAGGTHLPDVNFAMPVFIDGRVVGFSCNIAHHVDIGGMAPGSMSSTMTEIFQEGLRLPVIRLVSRGQIVEDIMNLILLNVRVSHERRGDYYAQIAACRLGEQRLREFCSEQGTDRVLTTFDEVIKRTRMRMRRAISRVRDGIYRFADVMENDGNGTTDIPIELALKIDGDRICFDFSGTSPQVPGNINCPLTATQSAVGYVLKALLDPSAPNNQGILDVIEIVAEPGSLLNPVFPAAVAYRAHTTQRVIDVILGALALALPEKVIAASNGSNTTAVFSGIDPRTNRPYLYLETLGGGCGARSFKDGKDGVQQHIANTANLPIEAIETEYPLRVREYSFVPDSGGAGQYRGGLSLRRTIEPIGHSCLFNGAGERFVKAPWGIFGGESGSVGHIRMVDHQGRALDLGGKPAPMVCPERHAIEISTPGAGGYGRPNKRAPRSIARDWRSAKFTTEYISRYYGVSEQELCSLPFDDCAFDYEDLRPNWREEDAP
jgi:N-methylhydantoinase B